MRSLWRALLVGSTTVTVLVAALDIAEAVTIGSVIVAPYRLMRLEVDAVIVSAVSTWYLGWKI